MFDKYNEFKNELKKDKSKATIRSYDGAITDFLEYFSIEISEDIDNLSRSEVSEYRSQLEGKNSTINTKMRAINVFLNWLVNSGYTKNNPAHSIKYLKEPKKVSILLTEQEISDMIEAGFNIQEKFMMALMVTTGMRTIELVNAKVSDVVGNRILVHGKGDKERMLPILPWVKVLMDEHLVNLAKKEEEYLFPSRRGGGQLTTTAIYYRIKRIAEDAGIDPERLKKITPHKTRHYFATQLLNSGADAVLVQNAMGHSDVKITMGYAQILNDTMTNMIDNGFGDLGKKKE